MIRNENPMNFESRINAPILLNGKWEFDFDDSNIGHKEKWYKNHDFSKNIEVPFAFETKESGINDQSFHENMWYKTTFKRPQLDENERCIIVFNGVDYETEVYLNGELVKTNRGASVAFEADVTDHLEDENTLVVYVKDYATREDFPRGKQFWEEKSRGIWYNRTSGIYKTVYIKVLNKTHIKNYFVTPDIDLGNITLNLSFTDIPAKCNIKVYTREDELVNSVTLNNCELDNETTIDVFRSKIFRSCTHDGDNLWSPENPYLYNLVIELVDENGNLLDLIKTKFGMRKISTKNGFTYLNNRLYMMKLVLIQGYFKDSGMTPKSIDQYKEDILNAKALGFNGCRMHQKIEDPYFYHLCDELGFICWCEMPSGISYSANLVDTLTAEWKQIVIQNYNHPSILTWVPTNESWGVSFVSTDKKQQNFVKALYHLTKSLDSTRLVVTNDGWEQTEGDLCCVHNYSHGAESDEKTKEMFATALYNVEGMINTQPAARPIYIEGSKYKGEPIILSEFGGISYSLNKDSWGYTVSSDKEEYVHSLSRVFDAINDSQCIAGYCYTQLYDVESECNGILTIDRDLKVESKYVKEANDKVNLPLFIK